MKPWMFLSILAALSMSFVGGCAGAAATRQPGGDTGIVVSGEGKAEAAPTLAKLRVGVEARRATLAEARSAAAASQARILEAVRGLGLTSADIQTDQLSLGPDYDYGQNGRQLRGYIASNVVTLRVRDLTRVGEIVDATVAGAGDDARVDGLSFEIEDPSALRAEARRNAVADARAKAEQLASALGATVGDPVFVEETNINIPGPRMMRMEAAPDASTSIEPGALQVDVQVRVRWNLHR